MSHLNNLKSQYYTNLILVVQYNKNVAQHNIAFLVHINHIGIRINHSKSQFYKLFSLVIQFNKIEIQTHFQNFLIKCASTSNKLCCIVIQIIKCSFTISMYLFTLIKCDLIANDFSIERCRDIPMNTLAH